jgi:hypothetical protein
MVSGLLGTSTTGPVPPTNWASTGSDGEATESYPVTKTRPPPAT